MLTEIRPCYHLEPGTRVAYVGSMECFHGLATVVRTYVGSSDTTRYHLVTDFGVDLTNVNVDSVRVLTEVSA